MAKYSKGAQKGVESAMKRMEKGKLRSGKSGKKVTNPKQAIAIGLSEAKKKGAKVPKKPTSKKSAPKKAVAKKAMPKKAAKKAVPKKAVAKKASKKPAPKKAVAKKAMPKKAAQKKSTAPKKAASKKPVAKKTISKKAAPLKKTKEHDEDAMPVSEDVVGKAANLDTNDDTTNNDNQPSVEDNGMRPPVMIEDPITAVDKKFYAKATAKVDPNHKIRLSSSKSSIRPSGKKPLWRK